MLKFSKTTPTVEQTGLRAQLTVVSTPVPPALAALITQIAEIAADEYLASSVDDGEEDDCSGLRPV